MQEAEHGDARTNVESKSSACSRQLVLTVSSPRRDPLSAQRLPPVWRATFQILFRQVSRRPITVTFLNHPFASVTSSPAITSFLHCKTPCGRAPHIIRERRFPGGTILASLLHSRDLPLPPPGCIHHTDRVSTPAIRSVFGKRCREAGGVPSMGSTGDAYDNAMAESFFATLERDVIDRRRFRSRAEARMAIFTWLEGWYNPHRRHSALGYFSPINSERKMLSRAA